MMPKLPPPVELQIDLDCAQESDDITISTPLKLQIDLDFTQGSDDIKIQRTWNFTFDLKCPQRSKYIKNPERGEFHTSWNVHKRQMISKMMPKFAPHGTADIQI